MLQSLHVKNLALIEETEVEFGRGLNILTGETGAGKSLLLGSINLALGAKFDKEMLSELYEVIASLETAEDCRMFFEDICTVKEILDISQRLKAAKMLKNGANYMDISKATGMSTATISRVSKCLEYGGGGYAMIIDRVADDKEG